MNVKYENPYDDPNAPYSCITIANYFIESAQIENLDVTRFKIQQLVYYAHGWYLSICGKPLVSHYLEAWQSGPVFRILDTALKNYGAGPVTKQITFEIDEAEEVESAYPLETHAKARLFLQRIWNFYKSFSDNSLIKATHKTGSPWHQTYEESQRKRKIKKDIPDEIIEKYFNKLLLKMGEKEVEYLNSLFLF